MEIHLVSSLTPEDECRLAPQVLSAIERILAITYCVRVETTAGNEIQHSHTAPARRAPVAGGDSFDSFAGIPSA